MNDQPDILTSREMASRYGVNPRQPAKWIAEGRLGKEGRIWFRTPGHEFRFRVAELDRMDRGEIEA